MKTDMERNARNWTAILAMVCMGFTGCNAGSEDLDEVQATSPELGTTEQAVVYEGHDYLFVNTPKTWAQAKNHCGQRGYNLVTIESASEEDFLNTQEAYHNFYAIWWIGYNDIGIEGSWIWPSGFSTYTNWTPGEPNNGASGEDCAVDRWASGTWNDLNCNASQPFICERNPPLTTSAGSCSFSAANTSNATVNTTNCSVQLYAGMLFSVGTCGIPDSSATGNTYLRIKGPNGIEIGSNDDSGGPCDTASNLSLIIPAQGTYIIQAGCSGSSSCSGIAAYTY